MKTLTFFILFAAFILPSYAQDTENRVQTGMSVPDFKVKMFDGNTIDIKELRGKVVLLNFWATWCPPCRLELSHVQKEIIDRFKDQDFVFLPISRQDSYDKIKAFREQTGYTFPMGMDPEREIYALFATATIPRNYIIDKKGKIVFMETGFSEEAFKHLIGEIGKALKD